MVESEHTADPILPRERRLLYRLRDVENLAVNDIDRLHDMLFFHNKGDIDFASSLADQVDVDTYMGEGDQDLA